MKMYSKDSIWQTKNGQWCHKNLGGSTNRFDTEEQAKSFKEGWTPHLSRLVKEGVMGKGDPISLKLYGASESFHLKLDGVKGKSILFSIQGKKYTLKEIKQIVSKKLNRPASSVSLNYNKTMHMPSGKTFVQLKKDFVSDKRAENKFEDKEPQSFDFLSAFDSVEKEELSLQQRETEASFTSLRTDLKLYEEAQFNILSRLQTLSQEKMMDCYRGNLTLFLSSVAETDKK